MCVCVCEQTALSRFMMGRYDIQVAGIVISRDVNSEICFELHNVIYKTSVVMLEVNFLFDICVVKVLAVMCCN